MVGSSSSNNNAGIKVFNSSEDVKVNELAMELSLKLDVTHKRPTLLWMVITLPNAPCVKQRKTRSCLLTKSTCPALCRPSATMSERSYEPCTCRRGGPPSLRGISLDGGSALGGGSGLA